MTPFSCDSLPALLTLPGGAVLRGSLLARSSSPPHRLSRVLEVGEDWLSPRTVVNPVASLKGSLVPRWGFQGFGCSLVVGGAEDAAFSCSEVVLLRGGDGGA